ncbi:MAG: MCE family protein [Nocardioidaceae bacterium]|nr:MCE family protein [Nocardioidaceae bacterium]MCL2611846.1 MCE family protein [Nocardioidaceae bacterium]
MQRLTRGIRIKLGLFVALALVGSTYLGASYVGFSPFSHGYAVTVSLPDSGGLFVHSEVTYRGVPVGKVSDLVTTPKGVTATLEINADAPPIPDDATVHVQDRSAIGEQYLDLRGGPGGHHLVAGDHLSGGIDALPPSIADLLRSGRDFVASVPSRDLDTVINQGYLATQGVGDDLRRLLQASQQFHAAADRNFLVSTSLIRNSGRVLRTQEESAGSIRSYSHDLDLLAATLSDSDSDLRTLIEDAPATAQQVSQLIRDVGRPLGILMSNLATTATVFGVDSDGVRDTFVHLPEALSIGWAVSTSRGLNLGLVPTFFDPLPCTQGYAGTTLRSGTTTGPGRPLNLKAGCTARAGNVRGPQHLASRAVPGMRQTGRAGRPTAARILVARSLGDLMGGQE